jgi:tripartite-type tricarboxylate transporter receptor subunit TctC
MKATSGTLRCLALAMAVTGTAFAQATCPTKPIRWIVPYAPGGGTGILPRAVGQKFAEAWAQPVIIENRPGGATNIGAEAAAKSPPDGHTLFSPTVANAINVTLFPRLNFDILRDFAHITNLAKLANIVVAHPSLPVKNARELIGARDIRERLAADGAEFVGDTPEQVTAFLKTEIEKWGRAVRASGARPEG